MIFLKNFHEFTHAELKELVSFLSIFHWKFATSEHNFKESFNLYKNEGKVLPNQKSIENWNCTIYYLICMTMTTYRRAIETIIINFFYYFYYLDECRERKYKIESMLSKWCNIFSQSFNFFCWFWNVEKKNCEKYKLQDDANNQMKTNIERENGIYWRMS